MLVGGGGGDIEVVVLGGGGITVNDEAEEYVTLQTDRVVEVEGFVDMLVDGGGV